MVHMLPPISGTRLLRHYVPRNDGYGMRLLCQSLRSFLAMTCAGSGLLRPLKVASL